MRAEFIERIISLVIRIAPTEMLFLFIITPTFIILQELFATVVLKLDLSPNHIKTLMEFVKNEMP